MRLKLFISFWFVLLLNLPVYFAFAQTGSWNPPGAKQTFPRTLLQASDLPGVRQSFSNVERYNLYRSVYSSANNAIPAANSTSTERRLRARLAKNAAFVRLINLKPVSGITDSLTATEKDQLRTKVISLLETINTAVETPYSYTEWQWRSKELIDYLIAYDLLRGSGVPESSLITSQNKLQEFAGKLYTEASKTTLIGVFLRDMKNNHLLMTASALGMAGVVLNNLGSTTAANQPQSWINAGMYAIDNLMWHDVQRQSEPGIIAGYAEGPYYFKYAFLNCLPFFRAFGNFLPDGTHSFTYNTTTRQIRNPYFDPKYDLLYEWATEITMPDGRLPALEDSYIDMAMPELALTGKPQFVKIFYPQNLEPRQLKTLSAQLDGTVDMRAAYLAANINPEQKPEKPLTALPVSGNLIMRSGTGFTGNYLHVYGKNGRMLTNSGGHNHGDASSFSLYAHGQLLALDAGYLKFDRRNEVGNANNHNLVLVDGAGPQIGSSGAANDAAAYIRNTFSMPGIEYGEVHTTYSGADIIRKTIGIRGEYYLMADFILAVLPHNYTWQLHGFGLENGTAAQGVFTENLPDNEGIWQKNGVSLRAHVTATDGATTYTKTTSVHETTYDLAENHTTWLVQKNNVSQTQFLAALHPFTGTAATSVRTLNLPQMAGVVTTSPQFTDLAVTKADTLLKTIQAKEFANEIKSDAELTFFSTDASGSFDQAFLQNGTALFYGAEQIIKSSKRANLSWKKIQTDVYEGYISNPVTLQVKLAQPPVSVSGQNLTNWNYDETTQMLSASFSQPSDFQFKVASTPLPVTLVYFEAKKAGNKVNLNWQTAQEINNRHFIVQRSTNGNVWEDRATVSGQGTKTTSSNYTYTDAPDMQGIMYYRLKQVDLDDTYTFSIIRSVKTAKIGAKIIQVYPNPVKEMMWMEVENEQPENMLVQLFNASGKMVLGAETQVKAGLTKTPFALPVALPAGLYLMHVKTSGITHSIKIRKD